MNSVLDANIEVHTRMADDYTTKEPHFRPENLKKVRARLASLRERVPGGRLLDVGCGTGFIIHLAADLFDEIHGVDITPAMMAQVDLSKGNITLHETPVEKLPFPDGHFDAVSAYSFIDHILDPAKVLSEVSRVLRPEGIFYIDLAPSRLFWEAVSAVPGARHANMTDIVAREYEMVTENDQKVETDYGIKAETFRSAEPGKERGGIDPDEFEDVALANGFSTCSTTFDWFLGQGAVMHGQSFEDAELINAYLDRAQPMTRHLFKYLMFEAVK